MIADALEVSVNIQVAPLYCRTIVKTYVVNFDFALLLTQSRFRTRGIPKSLSIIRFLSNIASGVGQESQNRAMVFGEGRDVIMPGRFNHLQRLRSS